MSLHESQLTAPARSVLQNAALIALRSGNHTVQTDHLLYALLSNQASDAYRTLTALGCPVDQLRRAVEAGSPAVQSDVVFVSPADQKTVVDPDVQQALEAARRAAIEANTPQVDTRALLIGVMDYLSPQLSGTLADYQVTTAALRAVPMQVDESAVVIPAAPARTAAGRTRPRRIFAISPIFIALVVAWFAVAGLMWRGLLFDPIILFLFIVIGWIVSLALHEFGHAFVAYMGGDDSVVDQGYLTLNPLKYTHPMLSIVMPVMILLIGGIGLPGGAVYINRAAIRSRYMNVAVSAAGPLANMGVAALMTIPFIVFRPDFDLMIFPGSLFFWIGLGTQIFFQITAVFINLLPIPGLDGYGILEPILPDNIVAMLQPLRGFGIMILIALFWYVEPFQVWFWTSVTDLMVKISVDPGLFGAGLQLIQFWK